MTTLHSRRAHLRAERRIQPWIDAGFPPASDGRVGAGSYGESVADIRTVNRRRLIIAAVVAGAAGLALVALGWWVVDWQYRADRDRTSDPSWWSSVVLRGLGFLAFGKAGFKIALVCVAGLAAGVAWLIGRRRGRNAAELPGGADQNS